MTVQPPLATERDPFPFSDHEPLSVFDDNPNELTWVPVVFVASLACIGASALALARIAYDLLRRKP